MRSKEAYFALLSASRHLLNCQEIEVDDNKIFDVIIRSLIVDLEAQFLEGVLHIMAGLPAQMIMTESMSKVKSKEEEREKRKRKLQVAAKAKIKIEIKIRFRFRFRGAN